MVDRVAGFGGEPMVGFAVYSQESDRRAISPFFVDKRGKDKHFPLKPLGNHS